MPTINQLVRFGREKKRHASNAPALEGCPFKSGVIMLAHDIEPRKPNSGHMHVCKVKLTNGKLVNAYVPGDGMMQAVREHMRVLVKGGGPSHVPGVKYRLVPGALDLKGGTPGGTQDKRKRKQGRSLYGVKLAR